MCEKAFFILCFLAGAGEFSNDVIDTKLNALTVSEIVEKACDDSLQFESTVYKNLQYLLTLGYVDYGINHGRKYTYYITQKGKEVLNEYVGGQL